MTTPELLAAYNYDSFTPEAVDEFKKAGMCNRSDLTAFRKAVSSPHGRYRFVTEQFPQRGRFSCIVKALILTVYFYKEMKNDCDNRFE